ncbi:MAG: YciI family protein [Vicinamibacterales bacterium]|jgi:hypothetical protein
MKQYLLSIYQPDGEAPPPEALATVIRNVNALVDQTKAAGVWVFNGGLHPPGTATVVRMKAGEALITDGPFAEGKEHIGGFLILKVQDLDAALDWARKLARALTLPGREREGGLPIEVRPFNGGVDVEEQRAAAHLSGSP